MMNNNENRFSTLSEPTVRTKKRRKKSRFKSQVRLLVVLGAVTVLLGIGVGIASWFFTQTDGIVDTYEENDKTYYSKIAESGFSVTDENGNAVESFLVDSDLNETSTESASTTRIYATDAGTWLKLNTSGIFSEVAKVDTNGEYDGGKTYRIMIFPRIAQENIATVRIHHANKDGSQTDFTLVGKDNNADGKNDKFIIDGFEKSTLNQIKLSTLCSFSGNTLTLKKLLISEMKNIDEQRADVEGYIPLVDENGQIRFAEYGLDREDYYELTDTDGNVHRLYIGDETPDGSGLYVRYEGGAEGERNAVYKIANDPGISSMLGMELSRTGLLLGTPESLVYPQMTYPSSSTTYVMSDNFTVYKADTVAENGYRKLISFSYIDLDARNYTINQLHPYKVTDEEILVGYVFNSTLANAALKDVYDISTIMSSGYETTAVMNYVRVEKLVKAIITDEEMENAKNEEQLMAIVDKAVAEDSEFSELLAKYGLDNPEYKLYYNSTDYNDYGDLVPISANYVWVSKLNKDTNTRLVWAPFYQQVLEIGNQYLDDVFDKETDDWASTDMYDTSINYVSSVRVTGKDTNSGSALFGQFKDILFELETSYKITTQTNFLSSYTQVYDDVSVTESKFKTDIATDLKGKVNKLSLSTAVKYTYPYKDEEGKIQTGSYTHTKTLVDGINLETIKFYCEYQLDKNILDVMTEEQITAVENYSQSVNNVEKLGTTIKVTHRVRDEGDEYGLLVHVQTDANGEKVLVKDTVYVMVFTYNTVTGNLTLSAGQDGCLASTVFSEKVANDYLALNVVNDGQAPALSEDEQTMVKDFYKQMTAFNSTQEFLHVTTFDENGNKLSTKTYENDPDNEQAEGSVYIKAFRKLYQTMLYADYEGRADVSQGVADKSLTEEEMTAFEQMLDGYNLKIEVKLRLDGIKYVYRMYDFSATKTFVTVNGHGIFYMLRTRESKLLNAAYRASQGDTGIDGTETY